MADRLGLSDDGGLDASYRPRWNIAPTDEHFIVTSRFERRVAQRARWGLVNRWARDNKRAAQAINAKAARAPSALVMPERTACCPPLANSFSASPSTSDEGEPKSFMSWGLAQPQGQGRRLPRSAGYPDHFDVASAETDRHQAH